MPLVEVFWQRSTYRLDQLLVLRDNLPRIVGEAITLADAENPVEAHMVDVRIIEAGPLDIVRQDLTITVLARTTPAREAHGEAIACDLDHRLRRIGLPADTLAEVILTNRSSPYVFDSADAIGAADQGEAERQARDVKQAVRDLRAVRHYSDRKIENDLVTGWLNAARWCGSSKNSQPWHFIVVREPTTLAELSRLGEHTGHLAGCDLAIAVTLDGDLFPHRFDLGRVAQSIMLCAHEDGIASCVAVFEPEANMRRARELLGAPADLTLHLAIALGYPSPVRNAVRNDVSPSGRRDLASLRSDERFREQGTATGA